MSTNRDFHNTNLQWCISSVGNAKGRGDSHSVSSKYMYIYHYGVGRRILQASSLCAQVMLEGRVDSDVRDLDFLLLKLLLANWFEHFNIWSEEGSMSPFQSKTNTLHAQYGRNYRWKCVINPDQTFDWPDKYELSALRNTACCFRKLFFFCQESAFAFYPHFHAWLVHGDMYSDSYALCN